MSKVIRGTGNIKNMQFSPIAIEPDSLGTGDEYTPVCSIAEAEIAHANKTAPAIIEEANSKAEQIRQEAFQKGYNDGIIAAQTEATEALESIRSIAEQALEQRWKIIKSIEMNIVELALEIAEKVVAEQIKVSPDTVVEVARKALLIAAEREHIQMRVNPEDIESVKRCKDDLMSAMDGIEKLEIIADRRIRRGGCVLETNAGNVDARIDSQLSEVRKSLMGVVSVE